MTDKSMTVSCTESPQMLRFAQHDRKVLFVTLSEGLRTPSESGAKGLLPSL